MENYELLIAHWCSRNDHMICLESRAPHLVSPCRVNKSNQIIIHVNKINARALLFQFLNLAILRLGKWTNHELRSGSRAITWSSSMCPVAVAVATRRQQSADLPSTSTGTASTFTGTSRTSHSPSTRLALVPHLGPIRASLRKPTINCANMFSFICLCVCECVLHAHITATTPTSGRLPQSGPFPVLAALSCTWRNKQNLSSCIKNTWELYAIICITLD